MRGSLPSIEYRGPYGGCWEWVGAVDVGGYGRIIIEGQRRQLHRVAFEAIYRPLEEGEVVMHRCDNPPCFRPDHLRAGTHAQNMEDMRRKGRGSGNGTKLTLRQAARAQAEYRDGRPIAEIAADLNVTKKYVYAVVHRERWGSRRGSTVDLMSPETRRLLTRLGNRAERARQTRDDAIREAFRNGDGLREIARAVGLSHPGVKAIIERGEEAAS